MLYPLDLIEAYLRGWLSVRRHRFRRARCSVVRWSLWSDRIALAVLEQRERAIGKHERDKASR
jgi:hypothetical protein